MTVEPMTVPEKCSFPRARGFSLIELLMAMTVALVLAAITASPLTNIIRNIKLHYAAVDLSGLLQQARIEAVRKNTYYEVQQTTMPTGVIEYYVDIAKNNVPSYVTTDPAVDLGAVTVYAGTGSGAPQETSFVNSFTFTMNSGSSALAAFNARGLPCVPASSVCPEAAGKGFVYFLSNSGTSTNWAAVVITPSGRVQVWAYDNSGNGAWVRQ